MSFVRKVLLMTAGVALTLPVVGAELTEKQAKNAVEYRQSLFQLVKSNISPLGAMAKGKAPIDEAVITKNALRLEQLGLMISDYFVADTRNNTVSNKSSDAIWENQADFNKKAANLAKAPNGLCVATGVDCSPRIYEIRWVGVGIKVANRIVSGPITPHNTLNVIIPSNP